MKKILEESPDIADECLRSSRNARRVILKKSLNFGPKCSVNLLELMKQ